MALSFLICLTINQKPMHPHLGSPSPEQWFLQEGVSHGCSLGERGPWLPAANLHLLPLPRGRGPLLSLPLIVIGEESSNL